ncbi:MAG: hypothetical protein QXK95_02300 [Nitrososphaerota archaeon]
MDHIIVETGSRIHLGFIDPVGLSGRRWGSIGLYVKNPSLKIRVDKSEKIQVNGPSWIDDLVRFIVEKLEVPGLKIECIEYIPRHVGLGSGTQAIFSIAYAATKLDGIDYTLEELANLFRRCRRSGAGFWLFQKGGLVVDGGKSSENEIPPLLFRIDFPEEWIIVLGLPENTSSRVYGDIEEKYMEDISREGDPRNIAYTVLMKLIPSLVNRDFDGFTEAVEELDVETSRFFQKHQGGTYSYYSLSAVDVLKKAGVKGVGQSSWGPTVYGFMEKKYVDDVVEKLRSVEGFRFIFTSPRNSGATFSTD